MLQSTEPLRLFESVCKEKPLHLLSAARINADAVVVARKAGGRVHVVDTKRVAAELQTAAGLQNRHRVTAARLKEKNKKKTTLDLVIERWKELGLDEMFLDVHLSALQLINIFFSFLLS